jgi:hypothetical protein
MSETADWFDHEAEWQMRAARIDLRLEADG